MNAVFATIGVNATKNIRPVNSFRMYLNESNCNSLFLHPIIERELIETVKQIPAKLSCGFDDIPMKVIKSVINSISLPLTTIFNKSLSNGVFPDFMKIAKMCPIHKSGDTMDINNYRPISLLPSFSKILEKLVHINVCFLF